MDEPRLELLTPLTALMGTSWEPTQLCVRYHSFESDAHVLTKTDVETCGCLWCERKGTLSCGVLAQGHLVCGTGQMFLLCFLYVTQRCGQSPPEAPDDGWSPQLQKFVFKFPQMGLDGLKENRFYCWIFNSMYKSIQIVGGKKADYCKLRSIWFKKASKLLTIITFHLWKDGQTGSSQSAAHCSQGCDCQTASSPSSSSAGSKCWTLQTRWSPY